MAQTIKLRRSASQGALPTTSQLELGEVAINTYDGKLYIKKNDGTESIVQVNPLSTSDLPEGSNLYFTEARARSAISTEGYLTGNQTITLSGDITGSGTTGIATTIADNTIGADELKVTGNGTTSQFLRSAGDGTFTWATPSGSSDTAAEVLTKIKTVDGSGSGLDADLLDGFDATAFATSAQGSNADTAFGWGDHSAEGYLTGNQTITLTGDVSGSGTTSIAVTIADDSHNHTIANVDGLQTALDGKIDDSQVLTNVPLGAVFTDTTYSVGDGGLTEINFTSADNAKLDGIEAGANNYILPFTDNSANWNTAYGWGDHGTAGYATQAYVGTQISNLVDSAPATLDTLNELAAALGDDPNFATTVTNSIAAKLPLSGGTLTGGLDVNGRLGAQRLVLDNSERTSYSLENGLIIFDQAGDNNLNVYNTNLGRWVQIWDDSNHGSGSGLDADLLDGQQGSYYYSPANAPDPTLTLSGDATGSATFTNLGNATLSVTVADDSHNHIIANVDGLQAALDGKQAAGTYNTIIGTDSDLNTSGATIIDNIFVTDGVITSMGTRNLQALDISAARTITARNYTSTTTQALFETEFAADGYWDTYLAAGKASWSYAGNANLTDAGRLTELAGCSFLTWKDNSGVGTAGNYTALVIAPNTGGSAGKTFIYNDQGSSYSPGWREVWTSLSDGSGSGLDADLLDGQHASAFQPAGTYNTIIGTDSDINTSGSTIIDNIFVTDGVITSMGTRTLTLGDLGYTGETNATADQTASEILTAIKTVDGSGSGLDADRLDGQQGSYYAPASSLANYVAKNTSYEWTSGRLSFRSLDAIESGSGNQATLEVYQDTAGADAFMQFHVSNDYAAYFGLDGSTNDFAVGGWSMGAVKYKVWHAGNDGSGSGLDADLLDGLQLHTGRNNLANRVVRTDGNGYIQAGWINTTSGSTTGTNRIYASNDGYIRYVTPTTFRNNLGLWWTGNDGSGSGLDADLLDGQHGSHYLNYNNLTNKPTIPTNNNQLTNGAGYITGVTNISGYSGQLLREDNRTISPSELTAGRLKFGFTSFANNNSGPYADFLHMRSYTDSSGGNDNLLMFSKGSKNMRLYQQSYGSSTAYSSYVDFWHTGNDGSGSGLDADLLDGQQGSVYMRKSADSQLNMNNNDIVGVDQIIHQGDSNTYMQFHASDQWRVVTGGAERLEVNNSAVTVPGTLNVRVAVDLADNDRIRIGSSDDWEFFHTGGQNIMAINSGDLYIREGLSNRYLFDVSNGTFHADGNIIAYSTSVSDERLKDDINTLEDPLSLIDELRGVTFTRKDRQEKSSGVIAQELEKVMPWAVKEHQARILKGDETLYKTVEYDALSALFIESIKALKDEIADLRSQIKEK